MTNRSVCIVPALDEDKLSRVENKLKITFLRVLNSKLAAAFHNEETFRRRNCDWLSKCISVDLVIEVSQGGRPSLGNYEEGSKSTKRRKIQSLIDMHSEEEIKHAFYNILRNSGKKHAMEVIENLLNNDENSNKSFSSEECLALIEDAKLSRWQYDTIRKRAAEKDVHIFIPYKNLAEVRETCYTVPTSLSINEKGARIGLQQLPYHTCTRLLQVPNILSELPEGGSTIKITMITKWGCDGASDQSQYKQVLGDGTVYTGNGRVVHYFV